MFGLKFLLISRTLLRGHQKWTRWFNLSCQHVDWNLLSKSAFARINTWMRFSNYAIQSQHIQVTFTFKKQNVRRTTNQNNSLNVWRTNPERYPESNKQHSNSFQKTTQVLLSFNNCMIQSQQIQDVYTSKSSMVGKIIAQRGPACRIFENTKKIKCLAFCLLTELKNKQCCVQLQH